jgi:hypothetical protein
LHFALSQISVSQLPGVFNADILAVITHILFEGSAGCPSACKARWPDLSRQFGGAGRLKSRLLGAFLFLPGGLRIRPEELRSGAGFINPAGW